jgi:hypothetical protein
MRKQDLIKLAAKRLAVATELLHQLWAVQTFEHQRLVGSDHARQQVIKIVDEYLEQTDMVSALMARFLEEMIEGHVERR